MKRALFGLTSLLLAGCVSAPPTTPQISQIVPETLGLSTAPSPTVSSNWWHSFGDPQMEALIDKMLAGNPTLASALARMRAAQAQLSSERAQSYPQISLDAQDERQRFSKDYIIPPPYGGKTEWMGTVQANLSWNLDFWGEQSDIIAKARSTAKASGLDAAAARLALAGSFAQAYVGLARSFAFMDIANDNLKQREHILSLTNTLVKSGLENASSQEEARSLLAQANTYLAEADAARDVFVHQIAALTGQGADAYATIQRPKLKLDAVLPLPDALPADLLSRRPDILAAKARVDAAIAGRDAAHAAFFPNINLLAFAGYAAIGLSPLFTSDALAYGAGPAIHLPIFDAGKLRADYADATADLDASVADYNSSVLAAIRQVSDALTQIRATQKERDDQLAAVVSAARSLKLSETRYRSGLSGQINVLIAQTVLLQAQQQLVQTETDAATQRVTLVLATGGDFDPKHPAPKQTDIAKQDSSP